MQFRQWLTLHETNRTGAKLGLYPPISDILGQYPPLYGMPIAADLITYLGIEWEKQGIQSKNGIVTYQKHRKHRG